MVVRGADYPRSPNEFYQTPAETTQVLLDAVKFSPTVCDPCRGKGALTDALARNGYAAVGSDLIEGYDFLVDPFRWEGCDLVFNPPYGSGGRTAVRFIERALAITTGYAGKVAALLPADFDSAITRSHLFDHPSFTLTLVLRNRVRWFDGKSGSPVNRWYVWDHGHQGPPITRYGVQKYP